MFQDFCGAIEQEKAGFDRLLESCGLLETPFDQSQFESDVRAMNEKMKQCEKVRAGILLESGDGMCAV